MSDQFTFDVFLSHSSKDNAVVHPIAEKLRADGLRVWLDDWEIRPGDHVQAKIEEGLEHSRVLVLCMSANAFGSDWAHLESGMFRFRDPLNKERRFISLRPGNQELPSVPVGHTQTVWSVALSADRALSGVMTRLCGCGTWRREAVCGSRRSHR